MELDKDLKSRQWHCQLPSAPPIESVGTAVPGCPRAHTVRPYQIL